MRVLSLAFICLYFSASSFAQDSFAEIRKNPPDDATLREQKRFVQRVVDGDTIIVKWHDRVRLIGVDAPEVSHPKKPIEYFGPEAKEYLRALVEGKDVLLKFDNLNRKENFRDEFDRLLAYVYLVDGTNVNQLMIQEGYAVTLRYFPFSYLDRFLEAEKEARKARKGIWAKSKRKTRYWGPDFP